MTCAHKCEKCGYIWDCAFPHYEECETSQEAFEKGWEGCNNWCPICHPEERQQQDDLVDVAFPYLEISYVN